MAVTFVKFIAYKGHKSKSGFLTFKIELYMYIIYVNKMNFSDKSLFRSTWANCP